MFVINSRNRLSGNDSNFKIEIKIDDVFDKVAITTLSIPKSWYLIKPSDSFILHEGLNQFTITLPEGNPTRRALCSMLEIALNAAGAFTYSVTYSNIVTSSDNGKITFSVSDNDSQPSLEIGNSLFEVLGFNKNSINTFITNTLISTNVIKLTSEDTILIKSDLIEDTGLMYSITSFTEPFFSVIAQTLPVVYRPCRTRNSNIYHFWITNEDDEPLDTNGLNITLTLLFEKSNNSVINALNTLNDSIKDLIRFFLSFSN